uniref:Uncharacterized protein n=1 Tax=Oryza brachyantha TaxID=4533 RepID=J3MYL7_ORYBR
MKIINLRHVKKCCKTVSSGCLGQLPVDSHLDEAAFLNHHLHRQEPEAIGDGEHHLLHLSPELLQVDGAVAIVVEPRIQATVQLHELVGAHGSLIDTKVLLKNPEAHELLGHLRVGEEAITVGVKRGEPAVDGGVEGALVLDEAADGLAVEDFYTHVADSQNVAVPEVLDCYRMWLYFEVFLLVWFEERETCNCYLYRGLLI